MARAEAEALRKAWNKVRRPALGTEVHALLGAWMLQHSSSWHTPMVWSSDLDWHGEAGRVAHPALDALPDPRSLVSVYSELAATVEAPAAWAPWGPGLEWPRMPGFYDLVTLDDAGRYRLWDFKTTSNFNWAKTADELREDPQCLLYALHAMQTFALVEIECNWLYLRTEQSPKAYLVTVVITLAEAEGAVTEMAQTALGVVDAVRAYRAGRLRVIDLGQNVSACSAYGGCVYHTDKGGPCEPGRVSHGRAMKQRAELDEKITARRGVRKAVEKNMAQSFAERKAQRDRENAAQAAGNGAEETITEADTTEAEAESEPEPAALPKARSAGRPRATPAVAGPTGDAPLVQVDGHAFLVPVSSTLGKALLRASKAHAALCAAFEGE